MVLRGELEKWQARQMLVDYSDLRIARWFFAPDLRARAFDLIDTVTAYDAPFVVLAESLDCALITRDGRMARSHGHGATIEVL